jgi:hypothetical protein
MRSPLCCDAPPSPRLNPPPTTACAAYDLANGGLPVYNTFLVGRSLADGTPVWQKNMTALGYSKRPASTPVVQLGVLSAVTAEELVVMDAASGQLRFDLRTGAGGGKRRREQGGEPGGGGGRQRQAAATGAWQAGRRRCLLLRPPRSPLTTCPFPPSSSFPTFAAPFDPQASDGQYSYTPTTTFANCSGQLALVRCLGTDAPGSLCAYNGFDLPLTGKDADACSAGERQRTVGGVLAAAAAAAAWLLLT